MENPGRRQPAKNLSVSSNIFLQKIRLPHRPPKRIAMLLRRPHPASASF
jgi:hypothetical protein